ncbi:hypothetical protein [Larkinella rosea]|uniref:PH domain-containing protein n=1 Tax=Larkinella rosea TaxID=2025312 RepID=A0A3P1BCU5_9BACT|nr:hypothetical protein [Larkinella rosea]RRA98986.1 hypothetical protein EHT25_28820 [Larkinella rosea]
MNVFLTFAFVFLPVGWFIYKMLRFTAKTVGNESPLAIVVSYEIDEWEYFTQFNYLLNVFFTLISVLLLYITVFFAIPAAKAYWHWIIGLSLLATTLYSLWFMTLVFRLDWQYWLITRNKTVTLDPTDKSLEIATWQETIRFTATDLQEIEKHGPGLKSSRMVAGYSYLVFKLKTGRSFCLNFNKSYLDFALEDYFKTVPIRYVPHKIPWIKAV